MIKEIKEYYQRVDEFQAYLNSYDSVLEHKEPVRKAMMKLMTELNCNVAPLIESLEIELNKEEFENELRKYLKQDLDEWAEAYIKALDVPKIYTWTGLDEDKVSIEELDNGSVGIKIKKKN